MRKTFISLVLLLGLLSPMMNISASHRYHHTYQYTPKEQHISHPLSHINKEYKHEYSHKQKHHWQRQRNDLINPSLRRFQAINDAHNHVYQLPKIKRITNLPINMPQSLSVSPNGQYAYICDMDKSTNGFDKLIKYNLKRHHITKTGHWHFYGHGQSITYYKNHTLMAIIKTYNNDSQYAGSMNHGKLVNISTKTLAPIKKRNITFKVHHTNIGDALAFDGSHLYEDNRILTTTNKHVPNSSIMFYQIQLHNKHAKFLRYNQGIYPTSGYYIQGMAYNPRNKRMYMEESKPNYLISFPLKQLQHHQLHKHSIHIIRINQNREPEGLSFTSHGTGYLVLGHPYKATLYRITKGLP